MSEQFAIDEVRDLPAYQFRSAGIVYAPSPAPTAILVLPDNSTQSLTLTQQGTGAATRYVIEDFSYSTAAQLEVRVTTTDTAADIAEFVEYVTVQAADMVELDPALEAKIALIGTIGATVPREPDDATVTLYVGTTYSAALGTSKDVSSDSSVDYSGGTAVLAFGGYTLPVTIAGASGAWVFKIEMSVAEGQAIGAGTWREALVIVTKSAVPLAPAAALTLRLENMN